MLIESAKGFGGTRTGRDDGGQALGKAQVFEHLVRNACMLEYMHSQENLESDSDRDFEVLLCSAIQISSTN